MISDAYALSLIAVLCALSLAIVRSGVLKPTVSVAVGVVGAFFTGYTVSTLTHRSDSAWFQPGHVQAPAQSAGAVQGEAVLTQVPASLTRGLAIRRGDKIATDVFDVASAGVLANHEELRISSGSNLQVAGWAADSEGGAPCKNIYLAIDNHRFALPYGFARTDVAAYFHDDTYTMTGYSGQVSAHAIGYGAHRVNIECLSADGKTLFVSIKSYKVTVE